MRDSKNKTGLFRFIADRIADMDTVDPVIVEDLVLSNHEIRLDDMSPCSHEEADTGTFVHARHAVQEGYKVLMIKANDTDVVIIAIATLLARAWPAETVDCLWSRITSDMDTIHDIVTIQLAQK